MINKSKRKINFNVKYHNHPNIPNTSNQKLVINYHSDVRRSKEELELPLAEEG